MNNLEEWTLSVVTAVLDNDEYLSEYDQAHLQLNCENHDLTDSDGSLFG